ncbi:MAG TPA: hypothetical protein H9736_02870, partial [Candidatus Anaerotruncus excrementipullorum]|nr:hypothetical protein [Candidatus Anaerotruncus excrementipullorum]
PYYHHLFSNNRQRKIPYKRQGKIIVHPNPENCNRRGVRNGQVDCIFYGSIWQVGEKILFLPKFVRKFNKKFVFGVQTTL